MSTDKRLFTNVLGNKTKLLSYLYKGYTTIIEPYGGSAAISLNMPNAQHILLGETDRIIRKSHQMWVEGQMSLPDSADEAELLNSAQHILDHADGHTLEQVRQAFLFRQSTYGGVFRINAKGGINVKLAQDKLARAKARRLPPPPSAKLDLFDSAEAVMFSWWSAKPSDVLVVIDPPYFRPGSTPCYPFHNPKDSQETFQAIHYVNMALSFGADVLFSAYLDESLMTYFEEVRGKSNHSALTLHCVPLTTLGNASGADTRLDKPKELVIYLQKLDFDFC